MATCILNLVDDHTRAAVEDLAKGYDVSLHVAAALVLQVGVGTVSAGERIAAALTAAAKVQQPTAGTRH